MTVGERIRQRREAHGLSRKDLARKAEIPYSTLAGIENGDQSSTPRLWRIAEILACSVKWLEEGGPEPAPAMGQVKHNNEGTHVHIGDARELVYVTRIVGAHLAAGTGEIVYDLEESPMSRAYDAEWMRSAGLRPEHCSVWPVRGDSMFPTIPHGSHVLIDRRSREPKHDRVFAIIGEDGLRLKRLLRRSDGVWEIHSDNPHKASYPTEIYVPGQVAIFGQCRDVATPLPA